jgi:branched-chain amino acid transport system permease protein
MTGPGGGGAAHPAARALARRHRLRAWEAIPWALALAFYVAFPRHLGFGTELLVTVLFALSLDLVLGYAGIVTLGHAAFFGAGAYTVGILAKHGLWNEPITGLVLAAAVAAAVGLGSGLVLLRTQGLTLLMLTLCTMALLEEAANLGHDYTGGFDGLDSLSIAPLFGVFDFNPLYPRTQYLYVLGVLFLCFAFLRTLVYSPFGQSLTGIRENTLRMHAVGAPVRARLVVCYTLSAAIAGVAGGLWAQANAYVNLGTLGLDRAATVLIILVLGGHGHLYGAFTGAVAYMVLSHFLAKIYPTAWQLGLGLLLVVIALFARNGIAGLAGAVGRALARRPAGARTPGQPAATTTAVETPDAPRAAEAGERR